MLYCFIFVVLCLGLNGGNAQEGVPCETPTQQYGICIDIFDCPPLRELLVTRTNDPRIRSFLQASVCEFTGKAPSVCCPETRTQVNTSPAPDSGASPKSNTFASLPRKPHCGFSNNTDPRIVNGIPAKLGEFPWLVALGYKNQANPNSPKWLCGGTLITDRHILTAGHCVYNRPDLYTARLGDLDLFSDTDGAHPETIPLLEAKIHEGFSPRNYTNDIAILTLARSVQPSTASPICLPIEESLRSRDYVNVSPTVAGWGSLSFKGPSSSTLQKVVLPVLKNDLCARAYGARSIIDDRVLCAGYLRGGKDACQGDSGGPLMHRQGEGDNIWFYQIGVVSYGLRCAEAGYPGVYTRVTAFLDWIQNNLN